MKWSDLPLKPTTRVLRQFAAAWLIFFIAVALHRTFVRHQPAAGRVLGMVSLIGIVGLVKPSTVRWLFVGATVAAFPIGWVVTHLVLGAMFYFVLTPLALWFRWRGRDELQLKTKTGAATFWIAREHTPPPEKYLKQY